jgi:hypothetical protein
MYIADRPLPFNPWLGAPSPANEVEVQHLAESRSYLVWWCHKDTVTHVGNDSQERESCSAALAPYLPKVLLRARSGSSEACPVFSTHVTRPRNSTCTGSSAT